MSFSNIKSESTAYIGSYPDGYEEKITPWLSLDELPERQRLTTRAAWNQSRQVFTLTVSQQPTRALYTLTAPLGESPKR